MTWFASLAVAGLLTFVELNCENLFDCQHDEQKNDKEWVIGGARRWSYKRYWRKVNDIGKAILACGEHDDGWMLPDMVALVEVENDSVLRDLTQRSLLRRAEYQYIMTQSEDERGIDVALLYSPFSFLLLQWKSIRPPRQPEQRPTRDILYAKGLIISGDTLHVFVVHSPSRYSGEKVTRPYRMTVAQQIGITVDSICQTDPEARIIVTGDFNDYTGDPALLALAEHGLYHVSHSAQGKHGAKGTYRYQGFWSSLDHFFVSYTLKPYISSCDVFDAPFLMEEEPVYGGSRPKRTYQGYRYHRGTSDHLPLVLRMNITRQ